jgi:anti-anti-sigma factor
MVVDLREVTFIDSLSLAVLVTAKRKLGPGGRLALVIAGSYPHLILTAAGLDGVLDVFDDRAAAETFAFAGLS